MISGPWPAGINNRQAGNLLPDGTVQDALNVDFDKQGFAHRRTGYTKRSDGVAMHSAWSGSNVSFIVNQGNLCSVDSALALTVLRAGIAGKVSYAEVGNTVYASDGFVFLAIKNGVSSPGGEDASTYEDGTLLPLPPGIIVREYRGRLYTVSENIVYYSEPLFYEVYRAATNWIPMPDDITVFEPVKNGIWVVSDKTRFLSGTSPEQFSVVEASDSTAAVGTSCSLVHGYGPDKVSGVIWHSDRGAVLGTDDGQLIYLQADNVTPHVASEGFGFVREMDGQRHFITSLKAPEVPAIGMRTWFEIV